MKVWFEENKAYIQTDNFDLAQTLDCGQAFRWKECNGGYTGVAFGRKLNMCYSDGNIVMWPCNEDEFENIWRSYFDLDRDYSAIIDLLKCNETTYSAAQYGKGIRILKQELWEVLISFIISANNSIHRIKGIIDKMCTRWGEDIGDDLYAFPTPEKLSSATIEELLACGAGYRAKSILEAAIRVRDGYNLGKLYDMPIEQVRVELMSFLGVGPKVAECITLYGLGRMDAFPVDTWIKKAMETMYLGCSSNRNEIMQEAERLFSGYAGLAQQYLFFYARGNKIQGISTTKDREKGKKVPKINKNSN